MKFALVNGNKVEAIKGAKGFCPNCGSELIAKCGDRKINHWAHKVSRTCDSWWEPETEWHRNWKNNYPAEWQEKALLDEQTGERHIADVQTSQNLVIEFQHSAIKTDERISREKFYQNMLWVIDGTRLKRDYLRFQKGIKNFRKTEPKGFYLVDFPDEVFPKNWLNSRVTVIFDFLGLQTTEKSEIKRTLWCLLPQEDITQAVVFPLSRDLFLQITHTKKQLFIEHDKAQKRQKTLEQQPKSFDRKREPTHCYDPKKGRIVKKMRF